MAVLIRGLQIGKFLDIIASERPFYRPVRKDKANIALLGQVATYVNVGVHAVFWGTAVKLWEGVRQSVLRTGSL